MQTGLWVEIPGENEISDDIAFDLDDDGVEPDSEDLAFEPSDTKPSPIAAAASDIVARLDALIEDADTRFEDRDEDWPESLITSETTASEIETVEVKPAKSFQDNVIDLNTRTTRPIETMMDAPAEIDGNFPLVAKAPKKPVTIIDELAQDDAIRARTDSAAKYIETSRPEIAPQR